MRPHRVCCAWIIEVRTHHVAATCWSDGETLTNDQPMIPEVKLDTKHLLLRLINCIKLQLTFSHNALNLGTSHLLND